MCRVRRFKMEKACEYSREDDMRLCVTSAGRDIEARIDTRFGRTPYFLIVDTETSTAEAVVNSAADQRQGAGTAAVQIVIDKGVDGILTGAVGPNVITALRGSGIKLFEGASSEDTVKEALVKFNRGAFIEASASPETAPRKQQGGGQGLEQGIGRGGGQGLGQGIGRGGGQGLGQGIGRGGGQGLGQGIGRSSGQRRGMGGGRGRRRQG